MLALTAQGTSPFPLATGDDLADTNVWLHLVGGTLQRERALATWDGTNVSFPYGYDPVTETTTNGLTYALLRDVDAALLSMQTNFLDERYATAAAVENYMATPISTNWYWDTNSLSWKEETRGLDIDHYVYPSAPPTWTASNQFLFAGAGTVLTWSISHSETVMVTRSGWEVGLLNQRTVTNVYPGYTTTVERALLLDSPTNGFQPYLMGEMRCMITQAVRIVASAFGDASGTYALQTTDTNGFSIWVHETNPVCRIAQTDAVHFIITTNGADVYARLTDSSAFRDETVFLWHGTGRGEWTSETVTTNDVGEVTTNTGFAGRTRIVEGYLGWRFTSWWKYYTGSRRGGKIPIFGIQTQFLGTLTTVLKLPTNAPLSINPKIDVVVSGKVWQAGRTYPGPGPFETHVLSTITQEVDSVTQRWDGLVYDVDDIRVENWTETWVTNATHSWLGGSMLLLYTNPAPVFGTPTVLTAEALNQRAAILGSTLRGWKYAAWSSGTQYTVTYQTNYGGVAHCVVPGMQAAKTTNVVQVSAGLRYAFEFRCTDAATHFPNGSEQAGAGGTITESARWFTGAVGASGLETNLAATVELYQAKRPTVTYEVERRLFLHTKTATDAVDRCVFDAVCFGCPNGYAKSCVTNRVMTSASHTYAGVSESEFTFRNALTITKTPGVGAVTAVVAPAPPDTALRGSMATDSQSDSCTPSGGCGQFSFRDAFQFQTAHWGWDYLTPFVVVRWAFTLGVP